MKLRDEIPLTIPQLVERVYPWLTPQAVHKYISRGLLIPERRGRGKYGSELSLSDAVTVGILHSLFRLGATFEALPLPGHRRPIETHHLGFVAKTGLVDDMEILAIRSSNRRIQHYLEYTEFKCHVYYTPAYSEIDVEPRGTAMIFGGEIVFFPSTQTLLEKYFGHVTAIRLVLGHAFINCWEWYVRVCRGLGINP